MSNQKMMEKREHWSEEVMDSLTGIQRATPRPDLYDEIYSQIHLPEMVKIIPLQNLKWVAAAAALLISINLLAINHPYDENQQGEEELEWSLVNDYSIY